MTVDKQDQKTDLNNPRKGQPYSDMTERPPRRREVPPKAPPSGSVPPAAPQVE